MLLTSSQHVFFQGFEKSECILKEIIPQGISLTSNDIICPLYICFCLVSATLSIFVNILCSHKMPICLFQALRQVIE